jgi:hypothetical protein
MAPVTENSGARLRQKAEIYGALPPTGAAAPVTENSKARLRPKAKTRRALPRTGGAEPEAEKAGACGARKRAAGERPRPVRDCGLRRGARDLSQAGTERAGPQGERRSSGGRNLRVIPVQQARSRLGRRRGFRQTGLRAEWPRLSPSASVPHRPCAPGMLPRRRGAPPQGDASCQGGSSFHEAPAPSRQPPGWTWLCRRRGRTKGEAPSVTCPSGRRVPYGFMS